MSPLRCRGTLCLTDWCHVSHGSSEGRLTPRATGAQQGSDMRKDWLHLVGPLAPRLHSAGFAFSFLRAGLTPTKFAHRLLP